MSQAAPPPPPYATRNKKIGCGTGCLVVIVGLLVWWKGSAIWESISEKRAESRQEAERAAIQQDLDQFGKELAPVLKGAIDELESFKERDEERLSQLESTLTALGRKPEEDPDWQRLTERLAEIEVKRKELTRKLEDAYLLWQKYLINQDPEEQARYERALQSGEEAARETSTRLKELLDESD
jgi:hypothetical protein